MSELYREPTPREAADMHGRLMNEDIKLTDPGLNNLRQLNDSEVPKAEKNQVFSEAFKAFTSVEEANNFLVSQPDISDPHSFAYYYQEELTTNGLEILQTTARESADMYRNALARYKIGLDTKDGVRNYAERYGDKLVTAALGEAALDGVRINHPDAIKI